MGPRGKNPTSKKSLATDLLTLYCHSFAKCLHICRGLPEEPGPEQPVREEGAAEDAALQAPVHHPAHGQPQTARSGFLAPFGLARYILI